MLREGRPTEVLSISSCAMRPLTGPDLLAAFAFRVRPAPPGCEMQGTSEALSQALLAFLGGDEAGLLQGGPAGIGPPRSLQGPHWALPALAEWSLGMCWVGAGPGSTVAMLGCAALH